MNARACFRLLLAAFLLVVIQRTTSARQHVPGTDAAEAPAAKAAAVKTAASKIAASSGPRSSPHEPPEENDHSFVTDAGPKLDTGCLYRSSGPIKYEIKITRHVGEVDGEGRLRNPAALVSKGYLSATATLLMPAFDVDSSAFVPGVQPERDRVLFNGEEVGFLKGRNNEWELNRFEIPIEKVKFPAMGSGGSEPDAAVNEVTIEIDTGNQGRGEHWCMSIDWGSLGFQAVSPIVLIHGNNSDPEFFDRRGFTTVLKTQNLLYDNTIKLETSPVWMNSFLIDKQLPDVVANFGVDGVHLITHSKGGLDARDYLANYQPDHDETFKIISLTTLSTPHNGSVGADIVEARAAQAALGARIEYVNFPDWTRQVVWLAGTDSAKPSLTTYGCAFFNGRNLPHLPGDIIYNTTAADADTNANERIDNVPDEYLQLRRENEGSLGRLYNVSPALALLSVDTVYQTIRSTSGITVHTLTEATTLGGTRRVAVITGIPHRQPVGNDTLVTVPSGHGEGTFGRLTTFVDTFQGRNHASIGGPGVATRVIPWIISAERSNGDLR